VVTPVIELGPGCTARTVRSLWEQIDFVRDQLTVWERQTGNHVRLKAYSSHYNVSFELRRREQNRYRNIKRLALLLAYILPVPMMILAANRRSTGIGVRPRGNRIEITADFTPDPGLMIATAALVVGIVREVMSWPDYRLSNLRKRPIPTIAGVIPGRHTTRRGWLTKDFHYRQSPYTSDINKAMWRTRDGRVMSLRDMASEVAYYFRHSIRRFSDPFSLRLLFAIFEGYAPSLLELQDRPLAYEDVGRLCRWGMVIHELRSFRLEEKLIPIRRVLASGASIDEFIVARSRKRAEPGVVVPLKKKEGDGEALTEEDQQIAASTELLEKPRARRKPAAKVARRRGEASSMLPGRPSDYLDRRQMGGAPARRVPASADRRRATDRRKKNYAIPFPDRRLTRSAYEQVFLKLVSGSRLRIGRDTYTPIGMKGWYHAIFRRDSDGRERLLTIDQLLKKMDDWQ
jgi:hypothetical protein